MRNQYQDILQSIERLYLMANYPSNAAFHCGRHRGEHQYEIYYTLYLDEYCVSSTIVLPCDYPLYRSYPPAIENLVLLLGHHTC